MITKPEIHAPLRAIVALILLAALAACSQPGPTTPPEGSAERDAIFAAMRQGRDQPDLVFVPRDFKAQGDWAWITADPQSKDGANKYETESWLVQRSGGTWTVAAQPCAEEGCDPKTEVEKIRARFPAAPEAIFPK